MNKSILATGLVTLMAIASSVVQAGTNATAEPLDIDPAILSKLALERAKVHGQARRDKDLAGDAAAAASGTNPPDCGAINIGNLTSGGKPGFQPREVTVVITGDVINANNSCR
jgi:hypothetical protein